MNSLSDENYMRMALNLARRGLGQVAPNPSVGCVIVKDGHVVGRGWTAKGGRPHAETIALEQAGKQAAGATAYVSLEPCAHHGKTPPCADALVKAGISRAVIACEDPDPRVSGKGVEILKQAGIEVETGVLSAQAEALNAGFILRLTQKRPFVTLKSATSEDEKIAAEKGKRTKITGDLAHQYSHLIRSQHDAILVGIGTVLSDDPLLTTRLSGYEHNILRIVLDGHGRLPENSQLRKTANEDNLLVLTNEDVNTRDIKAVLELLAQRGITRLLVEGGAQVNSSFLEAGFADEFLWFKAPQEIGPSGVDALVNHDISDIEAEFGLKKQKTLVLGEDLLEIYSRRA